MARERGNLGGALRSGALLDQLVVKIDVDLSGFRRGIAEAIAGIRSLKGAIAGQVGGASLGDAMTAALVVATARIGQMRNELRLLTTEMRNVALLTASAGGAGALVPYAGGGPLVLNATRRRGVDGRAVVGRGRDGRFREAYDIDSDDLGAATRGDFSGPTIISPDMDGGDGGGGPRRRGRRTPGWFFAFERGRRRFPGYQSAAENLGSSAFGMGRAARGAMGSNIARALGLVGLGSLFGSLISLAGNLATIISGTLAGAFAALLTPVGAVVALLTTLVALFVASNWDQFKEFGEWFATRWKEVIESDGWRTLVAGLNNLKSAFGEFWAAIKVAFKDDSGSITAVLQFFGEVVIRVINSVLQLLGGLMNALAELVRGVAALIRGDWQDAWAHFGNVVTGAFDAVLGALDALFPGLQERVNGIAGWIEDRFQTMADNVRRFFSQLPNFGEGRGFLSPSDMAREGKNKGSTRGKLGSAVSFGAGGLIGGSFAANDNTMSPETFDKLTRAADGFGAALLRATDSGVRGGMKLKDVLKQLLADLVLMAAQIAIIEPLQQMFMDGMRSTFTGSGSTGSAGGSGGGNFWGSVVSFIGSLFAGGFANGGFIKPGQWGVVGERGPEIAFGGRSGMTVHANDNGGMRIDARTYIDATGADASKIGALQTQVRQLERSIPARIAAQVGNMKQRGRL